MLIQACEQSSILLTAPWECQQKYLASAKLLDEMDPKHKSHRAAAAAERLLEVQHQSVPSSFGKDPLAWIFWKPALQGACWCYWELPTPR